MYYFIGIKAAGMSALASALCDLGYEVMGSDTTDYVFTEENLKKRNIKIVPFNKNNIRENMTIIKGDCFDEENEEVAKALFLRLNIYSYCEMVSRLTKMFQTITVAGSHGKTTTSAMMMHVLKGLKGVNYIIGDGSGYASKDNKLFVLEACEYKRHFLQYIPYYAVITNIDFDHTDYYEDINDVISAYEEYANNAEKMVIACGDDPYTHSLDVNTPIFYYGLDDDNEVLAKNVLYTEEGIEFDVFVEDNYYGHFDLPLYGKHQLLDALAVISVCYYERLEAKEVAKVFKTFNGAKRRFTETVIEDNIVIDDYAHHPAEIKATLKAIKQKYPKKELVVIFQPYTYSRAETFKEEYQSIFNDLDNVYIMEICPASEKSEDYNIRTEDLLKDMPKAKMIDINEASKLENYDNAVILFMSPNDISKLENDYIKLKQPN